MKLIKGPQLPGIADCVRVKLEGTNLLYFVGAKTYIPNVWPCDRDFANVILRPMEEWGRKYGFDLLHLGIYNYRNVRTSAGRVGKRLSNHAYGRAIDWRGIRTTGGVGQVFNPYHLAAGAPAKFNELHRALKASVADAGFKLEWLTYRPRGTWIHVGIKPQ